MRDNWYLTTPKPPSEGPGLIGMIVLGIGAAVYLVGMVIVYFFIGLIAATFLFRLVRSGSDTRDS